MAHWRPGAWNSTAPNSWAQSACKKPRIKKSAYSQSDIIIPTACAQQPLRFPFKCNISFRRSYTYAFLYYNFTDNGYRSYLHNIDRKYIRKKPCTFSTFTTLLTPGWSPMSSVHPSESSPPDDNLLKGQYLKECIIES